MLPLEGARPLSFLPLATALPIHTLWLPVPIPSGTGAVVGWSFGPISTDEAPPFRGLPTLQLSGDTEFQRVPLIQ